MAGKIGRIMGLLHIAKHGSTFARHTVDVETAANAVRLGAYFIGNVLRVFAEIASKGEEMQLADTILCALKRRPDLLEFKGRDILSMTGRKLQTIAQFEIGVTILEHRGYVKRKNPALLVRRSSGRPEAVTYLRNPEI
jgi:hypothetical protein